MRHAASFILLGLLVVGAQAQPDAAADPKHAKISVTGSATVKVEPDMGKIYVSVTVGEATVSEACGIAANTTDAVITAAEGVDGTTVTTENISVQPNITYSENGKQIYSGFICQQSLLVTVEKQEDAELDASISAAMEATLKAGGDYLQVSSMATDLSPDLRRQATNQARELAVEDAAQTADILAKAAKVELGDVMSIIDSNIAPPGPFPMPAMMEGAMDSAAAMPVQTGMTDVTANVAIEYAITQEA